MKIRKATSNDAKHIAPTLLLAMEEIVYEFIGENSKTKAIQFLEDMIAQPNNQYSYDCCWVFELENQIVGATNVYDGALLNQLRIPVKEYINQKFNKEFNPEDETQSGEMYIDCIGVNPDFQGNGIGTKILQFLINYYVIQENKTLGLLVEFENPKAESLYKSLGFNYVGDKTLVGKKLKHLQYQSN